MSPLLRLVCVSSSTSSGASEARPSSSAMAPYSWLHCLGWGGVGVLDHVGSSLAPLCRWLHADMADGQGKAGSGGTAVWLTWVQEEPRSTAKQRPAAQQQRQHQQHREHTHTQGHRTGRQRAQLTPRWHCAAPLGHTAEVAPSHPCAPLQKHTEWEEGREESWEEGGR